MNRNLLISIGIGLAIFFGAMLRSHLADEQWVVSPSQLAAAAKNGTYVKSANGGITVLPIRKSNAGILKYQWSLMGLLAGFACFQYLKLRRPGLKKFDFAWKNDKFYWKYKDYPELAGLPEAEAKATLSAMMRKHAHLVRGLFLTDTKEYLVEFILLILAFQLLFGFSLGAALAVATLFGISWIRTFAQRIPELVRAELQQKAGGDTVP